MWKSLAAVGISPAAQHAAHVTLAILPDDAPVAELRSVLASIASGLAPVPIKLCGFGLFPGPPAILWLATVVTPALLALHSELQAACAELEPHPHTRPGAWVPHFTLADNLQDAGRPSPQPCRPGSREPASSSTSNCCAFTRSNCLRTGDLLI